MLKQSHILLLDALRGRKYINMQIETDRTDLHNIQETAAIAGSPNLNDHHLNHPISSGRSINYRITNRTPIIAARRRKQVAARGGIA